MGAGTWRDKRAAWSQAARRLSATTYFPAVTAAVLAVLAAAQAISLAQASSHGSAGGNVQLALVLLSLIATMPLAVARTYPVLQPR